MEPGQHELYEYARKRLRQKKHLYFHFVLLVLGSLFAFVANHFLHVGEPHQWYKWLISAWLFIFILHFVKVFITDRFMNKNWEREQIDRMVTKQKTRIEQLETKTQNDSDKTPL